MKQMLQNLSVLGMAGLLSLFVMGCSDKKDTTSTEDSSEKSTSSKPSENSGEKAKEIPTSSGGTDTTGSASSNDKASKPSEEADPSSVGSIRGVVSFSGELPKLGNISMSGYADCSAQHSGPTAREDLIVTNGKMQNVFVSIRKGLPKKSYNIPPETVTLDQQGCIYKPHATAVMVGQEFKVTSNDGFLHNVHAYSNKGQDFNEPMNKGAAALIRKFTEPEIIKFKCDVHPWMKSYVGVFSHPYFAVTGKDGSFELKDVPPGKYTVRAWHEFFDESPQDVEVEVKAKENKELNFTFKK